MFGYDEKKAVMGMVERNGRAVLRYLPLGAGKISLMEQIEKYVSKDAVIYTDQLFAYRNLHKYGYKHDTVLHKKNLYAVMFIHRMLKTYGHTLKEELQACIGQLVKAYSEICK